MSPKKTSTGPKKRGKRAVGNTCDCCLVYMWGVYFNCATCGDFDLCFKCYRSRSTLHPEHKFNEEGYEWDEDDAASEKARSTDGRGVDDQQGEQPAVQFDDEIVGEDDDSVEAETEGGDSPGEDT